MKARPFRLVCPSCRRALFDQAERLECATCGAGYAREGGFPNLVMGERFEDAPDPERSAYEERAGEYTARHYFVPLFRKLYGDRSRPPALLSVGCGTGADVDVLAEAGFEIAGIDCGSRRPDAWPNRRHPERLYLANGKHLPFEDGVFDGVYCGCVFPHVGSEGDSHRVAPGYHEQRLALAREMVRVLKPGGYIVVSSPNRWCPLDLFHGRTKTHPLPRPNPPVSPFLLSAADYRRLFARAGAGAFRLLPVTGYWGFLNRKTTRSGRLLALPAECAFALAAFEPLRFLRSWPISPWLVMLMRSGGTPPGSAARSSPR